MDRLTYRQRRIVNDGQERATIFLQVQLTREEVAEAKRRASEANVKWRSFLRDLAQEAVERRISST